MKVLVTGATGFLGSWLCRTLLTEGFQVSVFRRQSGDSSAIADLDVEHRFGDITNFGETRDAFRDIEIVFHLAGLIAYSSAQRQAMEKINVHGTDNMVQAIIECGVKKLIHVSSVVAVGASFDGQKPLDEDSPFNVGHLNLGYFETKRKAEEIVRKAFDDKKIDCVIVNPTTVYGQGDARKGSRKTQVKVAQGRFPFYTSGGVNVVHVEDVVKAMISTVTKARSGERYILGAENLTIKALFQQIANAANVSPPRIRLPNTMVFALGYFSQFLSLFGVKGPITLENAYTATLYHWFDSSKAQKELDFNPRPARLAIEESVGWMKENGFLDSK